MDIDISQLPANIGEALERRHENVRVVRDGHLVANVVPAVAPVFRSHKALRERVGALGVTFAALVHEERDDR